MEECKYCQTVNGTRGALHIDIAGGKVLYINDEAHLEWGDKDRVLKIGINYCPVCGRKLENIVE